MSLIDSSRMNDKFEALIKDREKGSHDVVEQLLSQFDHQVLFDNVSKRISNPDIGRREWIICIRTLCRIDRDEANKRFIQALNVNDPDKRYRLVKLLSRCGTVHVVPGLIQVLKEDSEPGIRFMAAMALGEIGDRRALPALQWSVENDHAVNHEDVLVSEMSKEAIEQIATSGSASMNNE